MSATDSLFTLDSAAHGGCPSATCSASSEPLHVYDWLELPPANDAERDAKEWLDNFTRPAWTKMTKGINNWLARYRVTVEWKGKRYTCSGASRMGDVWLKTEESANYYDHRVNVEELSNWKRISLPNKPAQPRDKVG